MSTVIILGAKGRFGRAAVLAFRHAGWDVRAFGRAWEDQPKLGEVRIEGDAFDAEVLSEACRGCDVIVNALNPPYENWERDMPRLTNAVVTAAKASNASVLIPGNVYVYGADAQDVLHETTPWKPTTRKGKLRANMENAYRSAKIPTIVLRGGDFIEKEQSGNWFDSQITPKSRRGKTMYPGPLNKMHAWAYLPDMARAAVLLAEIRDTFTPFEEFCFEGFSMTGAALVDEIGAAVGRPQKVTGLPWPLLRLIGLFNPGLREVYEMRYLWNVAHRLDGRKLTKYLPDFRPTPVGEAMKAVLSP